MNTSSFIKNDFARLQNVHENVAKILRYNTNVYMCDTVCPPDKICFEADPAVGCVIGTTRDAGVYPHAAACCEANRDVFYVNTVRSMLEYSRTTNAPNHMVVGNRRALRELLATIDVEDGPSLFENAGHLYVSTLLMPALPDPQFTETMIDDLLQLLVKLMPTEVISIAITLDNLQRQSYDFRKNDKYCFTIPLMSIPTSDVPSDILTLTSSSVLMFGAAHGFEISSRIIHALQTRDVHVHDSTVMCTNLLSKINPSHLRAIRAAMVTTGFRGQITIVNNNLFSDGVSHGLRQITPHRTLDCRQDELVLKVDQ